jgi:DNA-binding CsgD family transcriptional regulator/tetratricopeptide (TPR) repeat protein
MIAAVMDGPTGSQVPSRGSQLAPMALAARRGAGALVGRPAELAAIEQELEAARSGFTAVTLEGEPGIGKSRLMAATVEMAEAAGFAVIAVTADEELRAPFLVARAILGSPRAEALAAGTPHADALARGRDAVNGRVEPGFESLTREERLLRTYDLGAMAIQGLVQLAPIAILVDDAHWADEDSLRMLRYVLRTSAACPVFLLLALRSAEAAELRESVTLLADMERIGVVRRLRVARFTQAETGQIARNLLGGDVEPGPVATLHAQSEGVPFIAEELIRAYRGSGLLHELDGRWSASSNATKLVPSSVRTLIDRRAARLDAPSRAALAEAAALGRRVSLRDLAALRERLGEPHDAATLTELLQPAVVAGLIAAESDNVADYRFLHEQVREGALGTLSPARRRDVHSAIVELLTSSGDPAPESLASLAHHALAAGDVDQAGRFSLEAARAALVSNAPEEALRLARVGLDSVSGAEARANLLRVQDDALEMLRQADERLPGLAELEALGDALGEASLSLEAGIRRAATFRLMDDRERAAELARAARNRAAAAGDRRMELAATLELGQALLGSDLGEGYVPTESEIDLAGAKEAFERALALAEELDDTAARAASTRELGVVEMASLRTEFLGLFASGQIPEDLTTHPMAGPLMAARMRFQQALELYEQLGDRRGAMVSIISLAYATWGADGVLGSAQHLEAIRRLNNGLDRLTTESERATAEAQLLYAIQVYASTDGFPDLALVRGAMGHRAARSIGDRELEFATAMCLADVHLQLGDTDEAAVWLDRASSAASSSPTPLRSRQLELGRGTLRARLGDGPEAIRHFERAVAIATEQGRAAARAEALARFAVEISRLAADSKDADLAAAAERAAAEVRGLAPSLAGSPPWPLQAQAASLNLAAIRDDPLPDRLVSAREIANALAARQGHDIHVEIVTPVARTLLASPDEADRAAGLGVAQYVVGLAAERIADEGVAARWFGSPAQRELVDLAGGVEPARAMIRATPGSLIQQRLPKLELDLNPEETDLVRLMMEGRTDAEIAAAIGCNEAEVRSRLETVFARMGAPSRSVATLYAFMAGII